MQKRADIAGPMSDRVGRAKTTQERSLFEGHYCSTRTVASWPVLCPLQRVDAHPPGGVRRIRRAYHVILERNHSQAGSVRLVFSEVRSKIQIPSTRLRITKRMSVDGESDLRKNESPGVNERPDGIVGDCHPNPMVLV